MDHIKKGKKGEKLALLFLLERGHEILKKNFRKKQGEIDLITKKQDTLHFIEVKYRQKMGFLFHPLEIFTRNKQKKMKVLAEIFLSENEIFINFKISFDLIFILNERITLYQNTF